MIIDFIQALTSSVTSTLHSTFMLSSGRHYWLYMACYVAIAIVLYFIARPKSDQSSFISFLFPRHIYTHPSVILDFKIWFVIILTIKLGLFGILYTIVGKFSGLADSAFDLLGPAWRAERSNEAPDFMDRVWFTLILTCCIDFGFFIMHYCQHKISWLWAFHKVHHSAEVLTPATANRHHPVDYTLEAATAILLGAIGTVVFTRYHGTEVDRLTLLNTSAIHCIYYMTANLRHSHLWLTFGQWPSRIFVSPAMHQIHHSTDQKHYNKNFGFVFSFWDWIFRCQYVPTTREDLTFGLHHNEPGYKGLLDSMIRPFQESFSKLSSTKLWARRSPWNA